LPLAATVLVAPTALMMQPGTEHAIAPQRPAAVAEPVTTGVVPKDQRGMSLHSSVMRWRTAPSPARELEVRARAVGLLEAGKSIGDAKAALGVTELSLQARNTAPENVTSSAQANVLLPCLCYRRAALCALSAAPIRKSPNFLADRGHLR
jgi:hypothetical protein